MKTPATTRRSADSTVQWVSDLCRPRGVIAFAAVMILLTGAAGSTLPGFAQDEVGRNQAAAANNNALQPPDEALVNQRLAELSEIPSEQRSEVERQEIQAWRHALDALLRAAEHRAKLSEFRELMATAPQQLEQLREENSRPIEDLIPRLEEGRTLQQLQADLENAGAQLEAAQVLHRSADEVETQRTERRAQIPGEIAAATDRKDNAEAQLAALSQATDPQSLIEARRARYLWEIHEATIELERLPLELQTYDARSEVLAERKRRAGRRSEAAQRFLNIVQERLNEAQLAEAERRLLRLERQWGDEALRHPALAQIHARNLELSRELIQLGNRIEQTTAERVRIDTILSEWEQEFRQTQVLVETVGLTNEIGLHLRSQRTRLPDVRGHAFALSERQRESGRAQFRRTALEFDRTDLADLNREVNRLLHEHPASVPAAEEREIREAARRMLDVQRTLLDQLVADYNRYFNQLILPTNQTQRQLVELIREYRDFIDERVLWIQSAPPLRVLHSADEPSDFVRCWIALQWLVEPGRWHEVVMALWADFRRNWALIALSFVLWCVLLGLQPRLRREMERQRIAVEKPLNDRMMPTFIAMILTVARAAVIPALMALAAWRLSHAAGGSEFIAAIAAGVWRVAGLLFALELINALCRPGGVADAHFDWDLSNLRLVRRHLSWLLPLFTPIVFILSITPIVDAHDASLGRLLFMVAMVALSVFLALVLHPDRGLPKNFLTRNRGGWLDRLKWIWYLFLIVLPAGLAVTAAFGYFYTAIQLELRLIDTAWLLVSILVLHAVLMRWLGLAQRRLAIEQWRKRRAAKAEQDRLEREARERAAEEGAEADTPAGDAPAVRTEEVELDVAAINAQTTRLVRSMLAFAVVLGLVLVWSEVLPAFGILREVELWRHSDQVVEVSGAAAGARDDGGLPAALTDPAGAAVGNPSESTAVVREQRTAVTLADVVLAIVIVLITVAVSRNIPGLLEIVVLSRLPMSGGARYAWVTIVRYALAIIGLVIAFQQLGITWGRVQWLAAAITVGLGFGLQEIFANFVSGLIILFERPIRVGDAVTVGDTSGRVTEIRMRATTILDWDRKELIVPNKEFVTGRVINWTLHDQVLRVRIPIGIAYGSDVELAKTCMLEAATKHTAIMKDPPPQALFLDFGDNSLDFELRVFITSIDHFVTVRDRMHVEVDRIFREHGIEIAFPQRDLHIRSVQTEIPVRMRRSRDGRDDDDDDRKRQVRVEKVE